MTTAAPEVSRETWDNTYSGFDRDKCRDFTGSVVEAARRYLPQPEISPTCKRKGHDWTAVHDFFPREHFPKAWSETRGCKRCARRGLIVLRTDGYSTEPENPATP